MILALKNAELGNALSAPTKPPFLTVIDTNRGSDPAQELLATRRPDQRRRPDYLKIPVADQI